MPLLIGFLLVLLAAVLQGTFVLPMTLVRQWSWEHTWATFSLLGMLVFNWIITLLLVPNIFAVYSASPARDLCILALFGLGWGVGAVLFGLGMERLGMALGYPIIMGLIASLGALIPLLVFFPQTLFTGRGPGPAGWNRAGHLWYCAVFDRWIPPRTRCGKILRGPECFQNRTGHRHLRRNTFLLTQCRYGIRRQCDPQRRVAGSVSGVFRKYGLGTALHFGMCRKPCHCLYLMISKHTLGQYFNRETPRNLGLSAAMALMWIGSFYLYGAGAAKLGHWGTIAGWPLFISLSIVVGNLWGLWRGEWQGAPALARRLLNQGLLVLIVAVITVALSNSF